MKIAVFAIISFIFTPALVHAQEKYNFKDLKHAVEKYNDNKSMVELKNGRQYTLEKGVVTEELNVDNLPVKRNFFDLENGVVIHDTSENEVSAECLDMITPFNQIQSSRIDEITEIGCLIYDRKNRLATRDDDLNSFYKKFCQAKE